MKVIAINGSPRLNGNTAIALGWMTEELEREGIDVEMVHIGSRVIRGCIACGHCTSSEETLCAIKDDCVNELILAIRAANGVIFGSPTYFGGMAGTLKCTMDRIFYAGRRNGAYRNKVGAAVAAVRRGGGVETYNQMITYYHLSEMIVAPSQYWGMGFGREKEEIHQDAEGQQAIRRQACAMAWVLRMIDATKDTVPLPRVEKRLRTNFVR